jgi:hypothetical protein
MHTRPHKVQLSVLDLAAILAAASLLIRMERGHRVDTDTPKRPSVRAEARTCAFAGNAANTTNCAAVPKDKALAAFQGPDSPDSDATPRPCASRDDEPYTASCIAFMSGWFWQPNPGQNITAPPYGSNHP